MNTWEIEADLIGTRKVTLKARTYNEALSKFQNEEYRKEDYRDDYHVDHILNITERVD